MRNKILTILMAVAVSLGIAGTASASGTDVGPLAAAICRFTVDYPVGDSNDLLWSDSFHYWYTPGTLFAGNCGAVWITHHGVNGAATAGRSVKFRLRTYERDSNGAIHHTFPWTRCVSVNGLIDIRDTEPGDISNGRGYRVYAMNCTPFYNSFEFRVGFIDHSGDAVL